jgi:hypothetical protein
MVFKICKDFFFFFYGGTGFFLTRGFMLAKQMLYCLSQSCKDFSFFFFGGEGIIGV